MEIGESRLAGNILVLHPRGRIDGATSPEFNERLQAAVAGDSAGVVVDLAAVAYISSAGLRTLMTAMRQRRDRPLAVAALQPIVEEIFRIARFQHIVPMFASIDEAAASWVSPAPSPASATEAQATPTPTRGRA